jgi:hypothetical protein
MKILPLLLVVGAYFCSASAAEGPSPKIPSVLTERDYLELGKYLYNLDKISPEVVIEQIMQRDPNATVSSRKQKNVEFIDASFQGHKLTFAYRNPNKAAMTIKFDTNVLCIRSPIVLDTLGRNFRVWPSLHPSDEPKENRPAEVKLNFQLFREGPYYKRIHLLGENWLSLFFGTKQCATFMRIEYFPADS